MNMFDLSDIYKGLTNVKKCMEVITPLLPFIWATFILTEWLYQIRIFREQHILHSFKPDYKIVFNPAYIFSLIISLIVGILLLIPLVLALNLHIIGGPLLFETLMLLCIAFNSYRVRKYQFLRDYCDEKKDKSNKAGAKQNTVTRKSFLYRFLRRIYRGLKKRVHKIENLYKILRSFIGGISSKIRKIGDWWKKRNSKLIGFWSKHIIADEGFEDEKDNKKLFRFYDEKLQACKTTLNILKSIFFSLTVGYAIILFVIFLLPHLVFEDPLYPLLPYILDDFPQLPLYVWFLFSCGSIHSVLNDWNRGARGKYELMKTVRFIKGNPGLYAILTPSHLDNNTICVAMRSILCRKKNGLIYCYMLQDETITNNGPYSGKTFLHSTDVVKPLGKEEFASVLYSGEEILKLLKNDSIQDVFDGQKWKSIKEIGIEFFNEAETGKK